MGCVHMHQKILAIEKWGNLSCVLNIVKNFGKDNRKARKTN
jgi:hypothetical protein